MWNFKLSEKYVIKFVWYLYKVFLAPAVQPVYVMFSSVERSQFNQLLI